MAEWQCECHNGSLKMDKKVKVSVIIPVYNGATYLRRCLDSVVAQTYTDYEAILIDDGSTDESGEVCDEYAARDPRFIVRHKENGGVSTARNIGIDIAWGEYLVFVDSDDRIEENMLAEALEIIGKEPVDMVCLGYSEEEESGKKEVESFYEKVEGKERIKSFICKMTSGKAEASEHHVNLYAPWAKLYRRLIIEDSHLRFDKELKVAQDFWFNLCFLACCNNVVLDNRLVYCYSTNAESLVHHYSNVRLKDNVVFLNRIEGFLYETMGNCPSFRWAVRRQLLKSVNIALGSYFAHPANKDNFWKRRRELCRYLQEPVIKRWTNELTWKDGESRREWRDIILLKCRLYWVRLLTITTKRWIKRFME